jgi:CspA family cold shock protein
MMGKHTERIEQPGPTLVRGTVLRTVPDRGFGFLRYDGQDYFFHYTSLENCSLAELSAGARVTFEPQQTPKGARAEHVTWLGD